MKKYGIVVKVEPIDVKEGPHSSPLIPQS
jgi:hypothetical protein